MSTWEERMTPRPVQLPRRDLVRVAWRMRGTVKTTEACVYQTDAGVELVAQWGPDDILKSELFRADNAQLASKADEWRRALEAKGWTPVVG